MTLISVTDPADSEAIGLGASRMRDERAFILGNFLDVAAAGADDTGATDCSASVVATDLAAAAAGKAVHFQKGTYKISSNITLTAQAIFSYGALLRPDNGITVTMSYCPVGPFCFRKQIFDLSSGGLIVIQKPGIVIADWWGGRGTQADPASTIQYAITSTKQGSQILLSGLYYSTPLDMIFDGLNPGTATDRDHGKAIIGIGGGNRRFAYGDDWGAEIYLGNSQNDDLLTLTGTAASMNFSQADVFLDQVKLTGNYTGQNPLAFTNTNVDHDGSTSGTADSITITGHGLTTGDAVTLLVARGDTVPTGWFHATRYAAIRVDDNIIQLATTRANAVAGTQVAISTNGSGSFSLVKGGAGIILERIQGLHIPQYVQISGCGGHGFFGGNNGPSNFLDVSGTLEIQDCGGHGFHSGNMGDWYVGSLRVGGRGGNSGDAIHLGAGGQINQVRAYRAQRGIRFATSYRTAIGIAVIDEIEGEAVSFSTGSLDNYIGVLKSWSAGQSTGLAADRTHVKFEGTAARNVIGVAQLKNDKNDWSFVSPAIVISSVDAGTETITLASALPTYSETGWNVYYHSTGDPIAGLTNNTTYFIIKTDTTHIKLADTLADALDSTARNLTADAGTGTHTLQTSVNYNVYQEGTTGNRNSILSYSSYDSPAIQPVYIAAAAADDGHAFAPEAYQTITYAATVVPNPWSGATVYIALTDNIAINSVAATQMPNGLAMTIMLKQPAAGSKTVTWDTNFYKVKTAIDGTANAMTVWHFRAIGGVWYEVGA